MKAKPIEGNRKHDIEVQAVEARAMETAATALTDADNVTQRQASAAGRHLRDVVQRFRKADRSAARKAKKK